VSLEKHHRGLHRRLSRNRFRHSLGFALIITLLAGWWLYLAPSQIGGPLTFAVVQGTSMEPNLKTGDLIAVTRQSEYNEGDIVIYKKYGGAVVHQIIEKRPDGTFITQGLNNEHPDTWLVEKNEILGSMALRLPGVGDIFLFGAENPILLGLGVAGILSISFIRIRRPKQTDQLKKLIATSKAEHPRSTFKPEIVLDLVVLIMLLSVTATVILALRNIPFYPRLALAMVGVVVSAILAYFYGRYVLNGSALIEPHKSLFVLKGRLYKVPGNVHIEGERQSVRSSAELRDLAEAEGLPVIHQIHTPGVTHDFILITAKGNFVWSWTPNA
jgi:signal peptidase I